jgi:glucose/arabinose dehydrogenase
MGAINVAVTSNLTVQFSEAIDPATVNSTTIQLRDSAALPVSAGISYSAATRTVTIDPTSNLPVTTQYFTVTVVGGASGIKDLAGNVLAADFRWSFSTGTPVFQETSVFSGLVNPTVVQFASDGRVFVAEKSGRIWVYDSLTDPTPDLFANLHVNVHNFWDRGLLGMALAPNFPANPYVYVLYTYDGDIPGTFPGGTPAVAAPKYGNGSSLSDAGPDPTGRGAWVSGRLSRLTASGNFMTGTEQVLIHDWAQQFPSHSIGSIAFGPDGALYATGGDGASFNYVDYGQPVAPNNPGNPFGDPANEGGALRSQDLRSPADPTTLDGSVIRIDPNTGAALPTNPLFSSSDANARRIIAYGLRNPFRFTFRPGTSEIWLGDVGMNVWEEINRVVAPNDTKVENFGWPAYEGPVLQPAYANQALPLLDALYAAGPTAHDGPYYAYQHSAKVDPASNEPTGSSSISGLAFSQGGNMPSALDGALFFSDYSRSMIWVMYRGINGLPDPTNIRAFIPTASGPVHLMIGPDGSLYYPDFNGGTIRRVRFVGTTNQPPNAVIQASATTGLPGLTVNFSGTSSSDPDVGNVLSYAWDLDGDGQFDDGTGPTASFTYTAFGPYTATLRVTDNLGASDTDTVIITVGTSPNAIIDSPLSSLTWRVGDVINFSGRGTDAEDGQLSAAALSWSLILHHGTHTHTVQNFVGVTGGSFTAPDHEYPSHLELRLTVTDSSGLMNTTSVHVNPQTVVLNIQSNPSGLQVAFNTSSGATPLSQTVIVGSSNSISTTSPQSLGGTTYQFVSWSDGGALGHTIIAPAVSATYTAQFNAVTTQTGLVAAYAFNEGAGTSVTDFSGSGNVGTTSNTTWSTSGRYGGALSFNGTSSRVNIADSASLDLTTGMTLEAWVRPTTTTNWRNVILKERTGGMTYGLYSSNGPNPGVFISTSGGSDLGPIAGSVLAANTWSHIAGTYDGAQVKLYVNGVLAGSQAVTGNILTSTGAVRIGGNAVWGEYFAGLIDEVRIYNNALTQAQIQADMNTPVGSSLALQGEASAAWGATLLTIGDARPVFDEAVARWQSVLGAAQTARLHSARIEIVDLPQNILGIASSGVIYLDINAAGRGWFIDSTPWDDVEFARGRAFGPAKDQVDLLTVLAHELGHVLGFGDENEADPSRLASVMDDDLPTGVRRTPAGDQLSSAHPGRQLNDALWAQVDWFDRLSAVKRRRLQ